MEKYEKCGVVGKVWICKRSMEKWEKYEKYGKVGEIWKYSRRIGKYGNISYQPGQPVPLARPLQDEAGQVILPGQVETRAGHQAKHLGQGQGQRWPGGASTWALVNRSSRAVLVSGFSRILGTLQFCRFTHF